MKNIIYLLLLFALISCKKEEFQKNEKFILGRISSNSIHKQFDPVIEISSSNSSQRVFADYDSLDVDNDGLSDFQIWTQKLQTNMGDVIIMNWAKSYVVITNPKFQIAQSRFPDMYYYEDLNGDTIKSYSTNIKTKYPFITQWGNDPKTDYSVITDSYDDELFPNNITSWNIDDYSYFAFLDSSFFSGGNTKPSVSYVKYDFEGWNNYDYKYLVFRTLKDKYYYGWIRLKVSNYNTVHISETYYQKNGFDE
jgi:hypothetical protein